MTDENLTSILKFETEIDNSGALNLPTEKLIVLREKGFKKVNVVVFGSSHNAANDKGIDIESFKKIKELQTLPDTVVLDFLSAKGKLKNSGIEKRI